MMFSVVINGNAFVVEVGTQDLEGHEMHIRHITGMAITYALTLFDNATPPEVPIESITVARVRGSRF